jgi:hypothetical protein
VFVLEYITSLCLFVSLSLLSFVWTVLIPFNLLIWLTSYGTWYVPLVVALGLRKIPCITTLWLSCSTCLFSFCSGKWMAGWLANLFHPAPAPSTVGPHWEGLCWPRGTRTLVKAPGGHSSYFSGREAVLSGACPLENSQSWGSLALEHSWLNRRHISDIFDSRVHFSCFRSPGIEPETFLLWSRYLAHECWSSLVSLLVPSSPFHICFIHP